MAAGASFIQHRRDAVECYICGCTDRLLDRGEFAARNRRHLCPDILRNASTRNRRAKYLRFGDQ